MAVRTGRVGQEAAPYCGSTVSGWLPATVALYAGSNAPPAATGEIPVAARAREVVDERLVQLDLVVVDALPDAAAEAADIPGLAREGPRQFALDADTDLVDLRLLDAPGRPSPSVRWRSAPSGSPASWSSGTSASGWSARPRRTQVVLVRQHGGRRESGVRAERVGRDRDSLLVDERQRVPGRGPRYARHLVRSQVMPTFGPKLFRSFFHMPPSMKEMVVSGLASTSVVALAVQHRHEPEVVVFRHRAVVLPLQARPAR